MKLWLIRHAKSAWNEPGLKDFDRPLNARRRAGRTEHGRPGCRSRPGPSRHWVWTSTAARAQATSQFVQAGFQLPEDTVVAVDALYHASPEQILQVVQADSERGDQRGGGRAQPRTDLAGQRHGFKGGHRQPAHLRHRPLRLPRRLVNAAQPVRPAWTFWSARKRCPPRQKRFANPAFSIRAMKNPSIECIRQHPPAG